MKIFSAQIGNRFLQHVGITFVSQVITLLFTIATAALIARYLGPEGKGSIALALLVPGMLGLFLGCGVEVANVYYAGSRALDTQKLVNGSILITVLATLTGCLVLSVLAVRGVLETLVPGVPVWLILLATVSLPIGLLTSYFSAILQGLQRITTVNFCNLLRGVFTLLLTLMLMIVLQLGLLGALIASIGAALISLSVLIIIVFREAGGFNFKVDLSTTQV